jgi:hypothetical protein
VETEEMLQTVHAIVFATATRVLDGDQHLCVGVFGHDFLGVVEDRGEVVDAHGILDFCECGAT